MLVGVDSMFVLIANAVQDGGMHESFQVPNEVIVTGQVTALLPNAFSHINFESRTNKVSLAQ